MDPSSPRALVLESNASLSQLLVRILERDGWATLSAPSAIECTLGELPPVDLIVCDVQDSGLPECLARLTADAHPYVLGLTDPACGCFSAVHQVTDTRFLQKPFTVADLRAVLVPWREAVSARIARDAEPAK